MSTAKIANKDEDQKECGSSSSSSSAAGALSTIARNLFNWGGGSGGGGGFFSPKANINLPIRVTKDNLRDYVGKPMFTSVKLYDHTPVGVVMGLAFNQMGGATLYIEVTSVDSFKDDDGRAGLKCTGQLGDVMKESSQIAWTVAKKVLRDRDPSNLFFSQNSLHMHVPEGATPKDGPSAGITMVTALLSVASGKQVRKDLAMTGEITLTGRVLPIGGVKEKTIAARREMATTVIFPKGNEKDFEELPDMIKEGLSPHFVETYDEVYEIAFGDHKIEEDGTRSSQDC
mmetsp:Transcript_24514/g.39516  ORF Transcript_24514/g.39516 Transcript_24514/m.39516 type:complete len:286 (-) Transcript_24514:253-1110(-)